MSQINNQSKHLEFPDFSQIVSFYSKKINKVTPQSFPNHVNIGLRIIYIADGKMRFIIDGTEVIAYPTDVVLVYSKQTLSGHNEVWDLGQVHSLILDLEFLAGTNKFSFGKWSNVALQDQQLIGRLIMLKNKNQLFGSKIIGEILQEISSEINQKELSYKTRVNHLIDELLIVLARELSKQEGQRGDFPDSFQKLDQMLRSNLEHSWSVEEMALFVNMGSTIFTEKVKNYSGFSPTNYLINLRIAEAIKLLKTTEINLTEIALSTGFYSSQHFSTTFKKSTGYTPGNYRKMFN